MTLDLVLRLSGFDIFSKASSGQPLGARVQDQCKARSLSGSDNMTAAFGAADTSDWHVTDNPPTEAQLRDEIAHYEQEIARVRSAGDYHQAWKVYLFTAHISHRRKLLAAVRDGRPQAWAEYPD